ncbi:intradiol dioxygenase-like protein [Dinothrombium tinctorium]|uniref:Intradiol dioxygenase-like protein n=1 Tax=Dinothrombium tinctorium TaxID=1965070 RepID=A0A3S4QCB8_9ACAR|nr:intradiol dioxygenase-like protein [Dinothrombium tinctorium]
MFKSILIFILFSLVNAHFRPERQLDYNSTVIDCSRFKRSAFQHACVLAPESMEGPYFIHEDLVRSNITDGKPGVPLTLDIVITAADVCLPISGAKVYVWHCDNRGYYSGFTQYSPDKKAPDDRGLEVYIGDEKRFFRGVQTTDEHGKVRYQTIYPGYYYGRAVHIHVEVYIGGNAIYVGQLYFPENLNEKIEKVEAYANRITKRTLNKDDHIYKAKSGELTTLELDGNLKGFKTSIVLGIDPSNRSTAKASTVTPTSATV